MSTHAQRFQITMEAIAAATGQMVALLTDPEAPAKLKAVHKAIEQTVRQTLDAPAEGRDGS